MASSETALLAFDTSAAHCAAALLLGDRIVAETVEEMARGQAERLMGLLDEMLDRGGCGWRDLDAVGVGIGPGNFTGIRIAVSAARGLALGRDMPAIGVSGFDLLARQIGLAAPALLSLPAPRGTVYLQRFDGNAVIGTPWQADPDRPDTDTAPEIVAGAEAARLAAAVGCVDARPIAIDWTRGAGDIARLAALHLGDRALARPAPLYVRPADAAPAAVSPPVLLP